MMSEWVIKRDSDYLAHHGIIGQKWGVRRFQNEDRTWTEAGKIRYGVNQKDLDKTMSKGIRDHRLSQAHTIPKGTMIYRVTADKDDYDSGTTYVSYMNMDRQHYRAGWIRNTGKTGKAYEHTFELQEDLNIPSRKEVEDVVDSVMKSNKKLVEKTCKAWLDVAMPEGTWERAERIWNRVDKEAGIDEKKAWKQICDETLERYKGMTPSSAAFFTMQSFGLNKEVRQKVIDELSKRGYNAMTDEASVGGRNGYSKEGGDPLIVFDRSNKFKELSNKEISERDEKKSSREYDKIKDRIRRAGSVSW